MNGAHSGVLFKRGYSLPPYWRPRFFAVSGRSLIYYQSATAARQLGSVAKVALYLERGLQVQAIPSPHPYELSVLDPSTGTSVCFGCETEDERDSWCEVLREVIGVHDDSAPRVLPVQQLAAEADQLIASVREYAARDRWMMAHRVICSMEESLATAAADHASSRAVAAVRARLAAVAPLLAKVRSTVEWAQDSLAQFESNEGWTLVQDGATKVSYRQEAGKAFNSLRVDTVVESDIVSLAAVLAEADLGPLWIPFCNRGAMIAKPSDMHRYVNLFFEFPFFIPLGHREAVLEGRGVDMMERNAVLIMLRSAEGENEHCELPPERPTHTRVEASGGFLITLLGAKSVRFRLILNVDLKVPMLRPALVNKVNQMFGGQIMMFIRKIVAKFARTEFAQRVQQNQEFYGDIEERLQECLRREASRHSGQPSPAPSGAAGRATATAGAPRKGRAAAWLIAAIVLLIGGLVALRFDGISAHWFEVIGTEREGALVALLAGAFGSGLLVAGVIQ
jgi:hypothetical protein